VACGGGVGPSVTNVLPQLIFPSQNLVFWEFI